MRTKEKVSNIAGVMIIFRAKNPAEIFIEVKDDGYPLKRFRRCLCPIGGNWIGERAKGDRNPLDTARREINEELTLERMIASTLELKLLGIETEGNFYQTPKKNYIPNSEEIKTLAELKQIITENCTPFGDFLYHFRISQKESLMPLVSYWLVALREDEWDRLVNLQKKFGNLSNESITIITSLKEIIETGTRVAFGHDRALQKFFLSFGLSDAHQMPLMGGITSKEMGKTLVSYEEYMAQYDIKRKP